MIRLKAALYVLLGGILGTFIRAAFPQDGTAGPPVILHHYSQAPSRVYTSYTYSYKPERMEIFRPIDEVPSPTFSLAATPAPGTVVKVFRNGILCTSDTDYTVDGNIVTVSASQGDVVQVLYTPS